MHLSDLTLDMSAVSLSSHVGERGVSVGAGAAAGGVGGGDDIRQPSVDGLHSPSSPNAPIAVAKQGMHTVYMYVCLRVVKMIIEAPSFDYSSIACMYIILYPLHMHAILCVYC